MILLVADSICGGFGQKDKKSFVHLAAKELDIPIWDESATGMSSSKYLDYLRTGICICPEQMPPIINYEDISLVVISIGNVDGKKSYKKKNCLGALVPPRYRKEKIDPRPYYSERIHKRVFQMLDNYMRLFFRVFAYCVGSLSDTVPISETKDNIDLILKEFSGKKVILISTSVARELDFPGASNNFARINSLLKSKTSERVRFFDLQEKLENVHLLSDFFHLNSAGHDAVKQDFKSLLIEMLEL